MANIAVVGSGYVGLVSGACLADFGNKVVCMDNDEAKIKALKQNIIPIYEPGLKDLVEKGVSSSRLSFTNSLEEAVSSSDVIFIAVGTPPSDDGSADLQYVENVARGIAPFITSYKVIVDKSTVPVGTARNVIAWIKDEAKQKGIQIADFDVVSNPEFLREGSAILDFTHPDRVVIGSESEKASSIMKDVYRVLYLNDTPYIETNLESAEMIKYASNAFLAVKITYINQIASLCEKVGANVKDVAKAMGRDGRIGSKFLHPGPGYGGSCFPKDTRALSKIAKDALSPVSIVDIVIEENEKQKLKMVEKIITSFGGKDTIKGKLFAILGLSFKPNTDDMREAPALVIL
ncbi:MAG: UDP-glucose dehydrogenase family protein, partial [Treponema sp.]